MARGTSSLVSPAYTGVALLLSWIYLVFYASSAGIEAAAPISLMSSGYMSSALTMTLTLLFIAFVPYNRLGFLTAPSVKIATPIMLSASTVLLILGGAAGNFPLHMAGGVLTGVFSGIMAQQWITAYRRVSLKIAICSFPALMAMAVCICITLMYLPRPVLYASMVALPILSEFLFHWVRLDLLPLVSVETGPKDKPLNYLLVILPIAICYVATGFLDYFAEADSGYTFVFYALCAFIPFVVAAVFAFVADRKGFVQTILVPVAFLIVMGVPAFSLHAYLPEAQFISIGELGMEVVIFIAAVAFSEFFNLGSLKVYALVRTCAAVFNSIGWYVAEFADKTQTGIDSAQFSLLVVFVGIEVLAVCLTVAIVKAQKGIVAQDAPSDEDEAIEQQENEVACGEEAAAAPAELEAKQAAIASDNGVAAENAIDEQGLRFEHCCKEIAKEYELSKRELDVFELLARGYASARIQKELYIAAGTVNYHTRNIYAKLGVHSKQEVIDLLASRMAG